MGSHVFLGEDVVVHQHKGGEVRLGDRVYVNERVYLETGPGGRIEVGERVQIHHDCHIASHQEPIVIGAGTQVAPRCALYSFDHGTVSGIPVRDQPVCSKGPILIEEDVWLGHGVIVLAGVRIGTGAIVGAGSVVTRDVAPNTIVAGNPARALGSRARPTIA